MQLFLHIKFDLSRHCAYYFETEKLSRDFRKKENSTNRDKFLNEPYFPIFRYLNKFLKKYGHLILKAAPNKISWLRDTWHEIFRNRRFRDS